MKKVLSLLVTFVFLQSQSWALSGGPVYPTGSKNYMGTYSGVLIPDSTATGTAAGSIGLFSFGQPKTGLAGGAALIFIRGAAFTGTITGLIDPKGGVLSGLVETTTTDNVFIKDEFFGNASIKYSTGTTASGSIRATIISDPTFAAAARVEGTAVLAVATTDSGTSTTTGTTTTTTGTSAPVNLGTETFQVDGFQQSTDANVTASR